MYGQLEVTPNMHLHSHLINCIIDYGPVHNFWLFSFERFNGLLGDFKTNQRAVEIQLMRKFLRDQDIRDLPFPSAFCEHFDPIFSQMKNTSMDPLQDMQFYCGSLISIKRPCYQIKPLVGCQIMYLYLSSQSRLLE